MKLNQKYKESIIHIFQGMQSNEGLLSLINYVKINVLNSNLPPIKLNQLTFYAYHCNTPRYSTYSILKKNGTERKLMSPTKRLKLIQKCLNIILISVFNPHKAIHGFLPQRSVVTNASVHTGQNYVYNIDLKDFFFSVDQARVWACLQNPPFNLKDNRLEIANLITALCCEKIEVERLDENKNWVKSIKSVLPQGAPTSPILTNIIAQRLDFELSKIAKKYNLKYSRYADDLTFSSMHHVYKKEGDFVTELRKVISEQNFYINEEKIRLHTNGHQRQVVTGLVVNEKVNIKRTYIKDLRMWFYLWERYDFYKVNEIFVANYKKSHPKFSGEPNLINVLSGKLEYLKMVIGYDDNRFKLLNNRFQKLYAKISPPTKSIVEKLDSIKQTSVIKDIEKIDLSKHKPKDVTRFLSLFRSGELKWLTHEKDIAGQQFNIDEVINNAHDEFIKNTKRLTIPESLYARTNSFIGKSEDKYWFANHQKYHFHWNSIEIREWCSKNPFKHPITEFENDINAFKSSIQIRENLKDIILEVAANKFGSEYVNYNFNMKDVEKAEFFTDVEKLRIGLGYIFNSIKQRKSDFKNVKIEFKRVSSMKEDYRLLKIIHLNSQSPKPLDEINISGGDMQEIMKNFYQIADWSIIASNPNNENHNKRNILYDIKSEMKNFEKIDDNIEGFTHELIFYS
jgi:RNA-directed DNA polymerase